MPLPLVAAPAAAWAALEAARGAALVLVPRLECIAAVVEPVERADGGRRVASADLDASPGLAAACPGAQALSEAAQAALSEVAPGRWKEEFVFERSTQSWPGAL